MAEPKIKLFIDRTTGDEVRAMRLIGSGGRIMAVCGWIVHNGHPWLLGNALIPESLTPDGGKPGDPGLWIDPATGELVIRSEFQDSRATNGDWVYLDKDGVFHTAKHELFHDGFTFVKTIYRETNTTH